MKEATGEASQTVIVIIVVAVIAAAAAIIVPMLLDSVKTNADSIESKAQGETKNNPFNYKDPTG